MNHSSYTFILTGLDETRRLAHALIGLTGYGSTLALCGPLGVGKTTLTAMIAELLGSSLKASSPSYVLQNEYPLPAQRTMDHWDLYRVARIPLELLEPPESNAFRVVEWADKFPEVLEDSEVKVFLRREGPNENTRMAEVRGIHDAEELKKFEELGLVLQSTSSL